MRKILEALTALACAGLLACGSDDSPENGTDAQTRALMQEIYGGIRIALPASVDERFRAAESRAEIAAALESLARNTEALERHTQVKDDQMLFLARSVARDARDLQQAYAQERYDRAAFLVRQITENCVVCHTRLPSLRDSPVAQGFLDAEELARLPAEPRATLQIATRRFDEALATLEGLLADPGAHPAVLLGPLTDYLVVSLRVKDDYDRAAKTLERFGQRPDLWTALRRDVEGWVAALHELGATATDDADLDAARALVEHGRRMIFLPQDRTALVHLIVASSLLERFIDRHLEQDAELPEAYYLLGIVEARIGRNYWVTPAPFLLEQAIRLAPGEPFAEEAYALLERETLGNYEGSDFEEIPEDDAKHLQELRKLIDAG